jgi:hypothetical protein
MDIFIDNLNQEGAQKFSISDHISTKIILEKVEKFNDLRARLEYLYDDFVSIQSGDKESKVQTDLFRSSKNEPDKKTVKSPTQKIATSSEQNSPKSPKLPKTPEEKYRIPILIALESLGGSAFCQNVLNIVEELMIGELNETDMEGLKSDPKTKRWRNTAMWARNSMRVEGLLKSNSPRGVWELDEAGWNFLKNNK